MISTIFILLGVFQIKHLMCDYFWQGKYMLGKFKEKGWVLPLSAHCGVHAVCTLVIALFMTNFLFAILFALTDFIVHFLVDRAKVESSRGLEYTNPKFWHYLGIDQFMHHFTHYVIILGLISL